MRVLRVFRVFRVFRLFRVLRVLRGFGVSDAGAREDYMTPSGEDDLAPGTLYSLNPPKP